MWRRSGLCGVCVGVCRVCGVWGVGWVWVGEIITYFAEFERNADCGFNAEVGAERARWR